MRLGLFFGAGAELSYNLPSGGKFAIELFQANPSEQKQLLRAQLSDGINRGSDYATTWLPEGFWKKRIHAFGKAEFSQLIESSLEYKKTALLDRLNRFDELADWALQDLSSDRETLNRAFQAEFGRSLGEETYAQRIKLNDKLANNAPLFASEYYSAMLDALQIPGSSPTLKRYVVAFLQLLVGAHGHELIQRLNQEIFTEAPDELPIFDDVGGLFRLEFSRGGLSAVELLIEDQSPYACNERTPLGERLCAVARKVLENLFDGILDYQALIDSHFRYLFSPRTEWAKFTKMVIFLRIAREYIARLAQGFVPSQGVGYYNDLTDAASAGIEIHAVGTANYNNLLERVAAEYGIALPTVLHLNGSVTDYYNPYKNCIVTYDDSAAVPVEQINVPFILTQSGLKPLTSVTMSKRYVDLYEAFSQCDAIAVVGYGFNVDDSHINGLFRNLVEARQKHLVWVTVGREPLEQKRRELAKSLRLGPEYRQNLHPLIVDRNTRCVGEKSWLESIAANFAP